MRTCGSGEAEERPRPGWRGWSGGRAFRSKRGVAIAVLAERVAGLGFAREGIEALPVESVAGDCSRGGERGR